MKVREGEESIDNEFVTIWKMEWCWMHPCVNDVIDRCLATGKGSSERMFKVQSRNTLCEEKPSQAI